MANLVHCPADGITQDLATHFPLNQSAKSVAQLLGAPIDRSIQTCVPKRLLAQKLVELSGACKALLEALGGPPESRDAALLVLMHCCQLNVQLSITCNKLGLLKRLLQLVNEPGLPSTSKVRGCC